MDSCKGTSRISQEHFVQATSNMSQITACSYSKGSLSGDSRWHVSTRIPLLFAVSSCTQTVTLMTPERASMWLQRQRPYTVHPLDISQSLALCLIQPLKLLLLVPTRPLLLSGGGFLWLLCQQSQNPSVQRLYRAQLERGERKSMIHLQYPLLCVCQNGTTGWNDSISVLKKAMGAQKNSSGDQMKVHCCALGWNLQ